MDNGPTQPASTASTKSTTGFWQAVANDIHVNGSGLVLFLCFSIGALFPHQRPAFREIAGYAAVYLFRSAKIKLTP